MSLILSDLRERLNRLSPLRESGKIVKSQGLVFEAELDHATLGATVRILAARAGTGLPRDPWDSPGVDGEIIGFRNRRAVLMPFEETTGIQNDAAVMVREGNTRIPVGRWLLGRVLNARGEPIDGKGPLAVSRAGDIEYAPLYQIPSHPLERQVIREPLDLGVRALNGLLTCGKGQRLGIMAGSGVGKSVLLGMMARSTTAQVNVIALIGERGREVREFLERDLGPEGLKRSVVIVATSEQSALLRTRGAFLAATYSEYFRDQGADVLLLMDSLTRFSMAQREIGLSLGEPPASKGYPPSVFAMLPRLLERAGMGSEVVGGSITGLYTVLVEGDDMDEPIADSARSILDGHIVLSRRIAEQNHFPAIDVLASASRVMRAVVSPEHLEYAAKIKQWMALYREVEDLLKIGAYAKGTSPDTDRAIIAYEKIQKFLRQNIDEPGSFSETQARMLAIVRALETPTKTAP